MPRVASLTYGTFLDAKCLRTGESYTDWRADFVGRPGMIVICETDQETEDRILFFYSADQMKGMQPFFRTSLGRIIDDPPLMTIHTGNSDYIFEVGGSVLSGRDKQELFRNVFLSPSAWLYGMDAAPPDEKK